MLAQIIITEGTKRRTINVRIDKETYTQSANYNERATERIINTAIERKRFGNAYALRISPNTYRIKNNDGDTIGIAWVAHKRQPWEV